MHTVISVSSTMPKLKRTNDQIPRKHLDWEKDEQILFCRTRRATVAGPITFVNEKLADKPKEKWKT